jgi:hypothetical protein
MNDKIIIRIILLMGLSLFSIIAILFVNPIPQEISYHGFIDVNNISGIANFWNVMSNIPFLFVGVLGLLKLKHLKIIQDSYSTYWILFFAVTMVAFGSGYYHLNPNNSSLVWDRLPMTVAFMSLFSIVVSEFIDVKIGKILLLPLLVIGVASVFYWHWFDDLRYYVLVQFLPILLIPLILMMFESQFTKVSGYWWLLLAYGFAKVFEYYDKQIFGLLGGLISGHSIKHIIAAVGLYFLLRSYQSRQNLSS